MDLRLLYAESVFKKGRFMQHDNLMTVYIDAAFAVINAITENYPPEKRQQLVDLYNRGGYVSLSIHSGEQPEVRLTSLDVDGTQSLLYVMRKQAQAH